MRIDNEKDELQRRIRLALETRRMSREELLREAKYLLDTDADISDLLDEMERDESVPMFRD